MGKAPSWALVASGVLYLVFHGGAVTGLGLGDDFWVVGLAIHGLLILATVIGLIGLGRSLRELDGWMATAWWVSVGLAILGLIVGHPFWSFALFGISTVLVARREPLGIPVALTFGAALWLYLFVVGVRIGDENSRQLDKAEEVTAVIALVVMASGLVALGLRGVRKHQAVPLRLFR